MGEVESSLNSVQEAVVRVEEESGGEAKGKSRSGPSDGDHRKTNVVNGEGGRQEQVPQFRSQETESEGRAVGGLGNVCPTFRLRREGRGESHRNGFRGHGQTTDRQPRREDVVGDAGGKHLLHESRWRAIGPGGSSHRGFTLMVFLPGTMSL